MPIADARDEVPNVVGGMKKAAARVGEMSDAGLRPGRGLLQVLRLARCFEQPQRSETHVRIIVQDPGRAELTSVPRVMKGVAHGHRVRHEGERSPCRLEPSRFIEHHGGLHKGGDCKTVPVGDDLLVALGTRPASPGRKQPIAMRKEGRLIALARCFAKSVENFAALRAGTQVLRSKFVCRIAQD